MASQEWYKKTIAESLADLGSIESGLTQEEAVLRLAKYGQNILPEPKVDSLWLIFLRQFQSPLIYILLVATVIVFLLQEYIDAAIIFFVLFLNAVIGTIQEGKSQNTLLALRRFVETSATVLRGDREIILLDKEVVPGDIILIGEGEKVPADARLLFSSGLKIDEAALTGESEAVLKFADEIGASDLPVADQKNMVWKGTNAVSGSGRAVVVATAAETVIGAISKKLSAIDTEIPLKREIAALSKIIVVFVLILSVGLLALGVYLGNSVPEMFLVVVALAVAVVPEGLPVVLTLVLALGVFRMSRRNVLVKRLQAVESLGQTKIIAVDKTGTLTKNEMVIERIYIAGKFFEIGGVGYEPSGDIKFQGRVIDSLNHPELIMAGKIAAFCANARAMYSDESKMWKVRGDPTEAAMHVLAKKIGFDKDELEREDPIIAEIPFSYETKYHTVVHRLDGQILMTVVGAPEKVLSLCSLYQNGTEAVKINKEAEVEIEQAFEELTGAGFRVLALATSDKVPNKLEAENINNLTFVGFFGLRDALRPEVPEALARAQAAGIRVVMITGDHKKTAEAIARDAGIWHKGDLVMTGEELDKLAPKDLAKLLDQVSVFARVTPDHKLKIIEAFRARGEIVAMTGDGVNDAPSLVAADLGVAMGRIGTEVAKEAADIVLLDDNFGSIISAVEEGRSIYKTIKKVLLYLFTVGLSGVIVITTALLLAMPLPLQPAQIIWLNLVTSFLVLAFAYEPKELDLLTRRFRRSGKFLVDRMMIVRMLLMSSVMAISALILFKANLDPENMTRAWTISLTTLAACQWLNAWNCRSDRDTIFSMASFNNKYLWLALGLVIGLQLLVVYNPLMQRIFNTAALSFVDWLYIVGIAFTVILVEELRKLITRRFFTKT